MMGVLMLPGQTSVTLMPCRCISICSDSVNPTSPNLLTL